MTTSAPDSKLEYRPDIDGLRAIAVGLVVVFHACPSVLESGFVGVDVFFVISGYLITRVLRNSATTPPALRAFYGRRVRRLWPSLLVVTAATLAYASRVLLQREFEPVVAQALGGLGFVANFVMYAEVGYFNASAQLKPLQHLWSLSVEEQFYLLWPLVVWVTRRWGRRVSLWALVAVCAVSFAWSLQLIVTDPEAAFYLPWGRWWELGLGGLLAGSTLRVPAVCSWVGLSLIVAAATLTPHAGFPGVFVLAPTLGTALIIAAGPQAFLNQSLLARRHLVTLGLMSYPLYLVHWPLLVFAHILADGPASLEVRLTLIVVSVLVAAALWRWLERPLRGDVRATGPLLIASAVVAIGAGLVLHVREPSPQVKVVEAAMKDWRFPPVGFSPWPFEGEAFFSMGPEVPQVLFLGDSNMQQYAPRFELREQRGSARSFVFATRGGCSVVVRTEAAKCGAYFDHAHQLAARAQFRTVVIGTQWVNGVLRGRSASELDRIFDDFGAWLLLLHHEGKRVVVVASLPAHDSLDPKHLLHRDAWRGLTVEPTAVSREVVDAQLFELNARLKAQVSVSGAEVIDPLEVLCDAQRCPSATVDGEPIYKDAAHLRARYVREHFAVFDELLDPVGHL